MNLVVKALKRSFINIKFYWPNSQLSARIHQANFLDISCILMSFEKLSNLFSFLILSCFSKVGIMCACAIIIVTYAFGFI